MSVLDLGDALRPVDDGGSHRVARTVRDTDLADYQRVVRSLLAAPYVGPDEKERLASLRRWEHDLRVDLESVGRYRLEIAPTAALLVRRPVVFDPYRPARNGAKPAKPFDPRRYAYLCMLLSGLLSTGLQVLLSALARQLADDAFGVDGLGFDADVFAQRQAFIDVVRWLVDRGVLRLRDGSAFADLDEDALYDVDHEALHLIAPSLGLRDLGSIRDRLSESFGESRDELRAQVRQRVLRLLLDRPFVLFDDLDADERAWLQRNGARVEADLHRLTGMQVERRREGVALIDTEDDASARSFPRGGSEAQLALLLADRLCTDSQRADDLARARVTMPRLRDETGRLAALIDVARPGGDDEPRPGPENDDRDIVDAWRLDELEAIVRELATAYPLRRDLRNDPAEGTRLALDELLTLGLVRTAVSDDGATLVVAMAPIARYRRNEADTSTAGASTSIVGRDQLDLFGDLA